MLVFFRCVAEAVMENGARGLMDMGRVESTPATSQPAPGRSTARKKDAEIQKLAAASFKEARIAAVEVAKEVAGKAPIGDRLNLELLLSQVPGTVR